MRNSILSRKAKWYIGIVAYLVLAALLLSLRWVSQVGKVVLMDAEVARSPFGRTTAAQSEKVCPPPPVAQQPHHSKPISWFILLSLTDAEVKQPVEIGEGCLPASLVIYEVRTIAGKDLPGYTISVVCDEKPTRSLAVPVPFFQLSRTTAQTTRRKVTLLAMHKQGDWYAANVGLFSPRLRDVPGWSAPSPTDFYQITCSAPNEGQKRYRWATFVPLPVYQKIRFCEQEVKAYAFYRTREQARGATLHLWDASGNTEVVNPQISSTTVVEAQGGKAERTFTSGRLSITIPRGWEQELGELTFYTGRGTERSRLIFLWEKPVARGSTPQQQVELLERTVLSLEGISQVSESSTRIDGKPAHAIKFRLTREGEASLRGKHITVPLKNSVVTVFWYVHESDWQKGQEEMERIVRTIRIK